MTSLVERLGRRCAGLEGSGVRRSRDLDRVAALPRRILDFSSVPDLTDAFALPGSTVRLRPAQSAALWEMERAGGLVGALGVGTGKTLVALLGPVAVGAERPVLVVPPELRRKLVERDLPRWSRELTLHPSLSILSYNDLSVASGSDLLKRLAPDWIFLDEAHRLRRPESARTKRFRRYLREHSGTRVVALTGSLSGGGLASWAPLVVAALREGAPVPLSWREQAEWADALDPDPPPDRPRLPPGALRVLCREGETALDAFGRRLRETPGWVSSTGSAFGGSLYLRGVEQRLPPVLLDALRDLRETWAIGGREYADASQVAHAIKTLACGFWLRWEWPGGHPDVEWLEARRGWAMWCRSRLRGAPEGRDSEALLAAAVRRGEVPEGAALLAAWDVVSGRPEPDVVPVWVSDEPAREAAAWARAERGVVWTPYPAFGERLAELGVPWYGAGTDAGDADPSGGIACSSVVQREGKDLVGWSRALVVSPSASATSWEQTIGRHHRPGQRADEVWVDAWVAVPEARRAIARARVRADHDRRVLGSDQKLLVATLVGLD